MEIRLDMIRSVANAISYLHTMNIVHRDLKSQNLLVDKDYRICVADLGISRVRSLRMTKGMGTPRYMAPELLEGKPYNEKADVYSFGILAWEILSQKLPYSEYSSPW